MTYSTACETLGLTTPKTLEENAELAARKLGALAPNAPLKYKAACHVLIEAAKQRSTP